jgi:hypothetical protein
LIVFGRADAPSDVCTAFNQTQTDVIDCEPTSGPTAFIRDRVNRDGSDLDCSKTVNPQ